MFTVFGNWLDKYGNAGYSKIFTYGAIATLVAIIAATLLHRISKKSKKAETPEVAGS